MVYAVVPVTYETEIVLISNDFPASRLVVRTSSAIIQCNSSGSSRNLHGALAAIDCELVYVYDRHSADFHFLFFGVH